MSQDIDWNRLLDRLEHATPDLLQAIVVRIDIPPGLAPIRTAADLIQYCKATVIHDKLLEAMAKVLKIKPHQFMTSPPTTGDTNPSSDEADRNKNPTIHIHNMTVNDGGVGVSVSVTPPKIQTKSTATLVDELDDGEQIVYQTLLDIAMREGHGDIIMIESMMSALDVPTSLSTDALDSALEIMNIQGLANLCPSRYTWSPEYGGLPAWVQPTKRALLQIVDAHFGSFEHLSAKFVSAISTLKPKQSDFLQIGCIIEAIYDQDGTYVNPRVARFMLEEFERKSFIKFQNERFYVGDPVRPDGEGYHDSLFRVTTKFLKQFNIAHD